MNGQSQNRGVVNYAPIPLSLLILEDRPADAELMLYELRQAGFEPHWQRVETRADYLAQLHPALDVILADYDLPQFGAPRALQLLQERKLDVPFIVVSGRISEEVAVECMKQGAADYLLKDRLARLGPAVAHSLQEKKLRDEKRQAEVALRESEARFRRLAENAPDVIYRYRLLPTRGFEYISPAVMAVTGYAPEEFYADAGTVLKLVPPEEQKAIQQFISAPPDLPQPMVLRLVCKDGSTIWVEQRHVSIYNEQGNLTAVEGIARDVTERVRAEEKLRSRGRFLALLNGITRAALETPDLAAMLQTLADRLGELFDADGCYITLWDEERQLTIPAAACGPARETYPATRVVPDEPTMTQAVLRAGHPIAVEDVYHTPHLSRRIAGLFPDRSLLGLPLVAGEQKLGAALIAFNQPHHFTPGEIARGEQAAGQIALAVAKAQLLESERQQRELAETLRQVGSVLNTTLDREQVLPLILEQLARVVEYDSASVMLLSDDALKMVARRSLISEGKIGIAPLWVEMLAHVQQVLERRLPVIIPNTAADPRWQPLPGTEYIHCWLGVPLAVQGRVIGLLNLNKEQVDFYTQRDAQVAVTFAGQAAVAIESARLHQDLQRRLEELQRAQAQLVQSARMATVGELAAGVAHEINNPLTGILGMAQVLARTVSAPQDKKDLEDIVEQARRVRDVVRGLQDFAGGPARRGRSDVNQLLRDTLPFVQGQARQRGIQIIERFAPDLPWPVVEARQIRQLFLSLISRALHVMPDGSDLLLSTALAEVGEQCRIDVGFQDSGPPIPPDDVEALFEVIFDSQSPRPGFRLGLVAGRAIAQEHGGDIIVQSEPGGGTTFTVQLPCE